MELVDVLQRCRVLCLGARDATYASRSASEVVAALELEINAIESGKEPNREELKSLFAPTGDLQETSIVNNCVEEYLFLSSRFDELIG
jgi:hypothetical protein